MATELGHQAAAGSLPESPANQLFKCRSVLAVFKRFRLVTVALGQFIGNIFDLRLLLRDFPFPLLDVLRVGGRINLFMSTITDRLPTLELAGELRIAGQRRLPAVAAGLVATVPLGANMMDLAQ